MNVHYLELFYYVGKYQGITPAVRRMPYGIQQPAVSAQLLKLEEQLGVKLFHRRPFALTRQGRDLYAFIEPFFSRLPRVAEEISGQGEHHLRLGASAIVLAHFLPVLLERLKNEFPDLRVTLRQISPVEAEELLREEEIDLAITVNPGTSAPGTRKHRLLELPLLVLVPEDSRWNSFTDLSKAIEEHTVHEPLISLPAHEPVRLLFEKGLAKRKIKWPVQMEVHQIELIPNYVAQGFGCGLFVGIPGWKLRPGLRALPLPGFPRLEVAAFHRGFLNEVGQRLVKLSEKVASGLTRA